MCTLNTHLFIIEEADTESSNWFRKGKSVPNMWKCLDSGKVGREVFV